MNRKLLWSGYYIYNWLRSIFNRVMKRLHLPFELNSFVKKNELASVDDANKRIEEIILKGCPALISRFGSNEAYCTAEGIGVHLGLKKHISRRIIRQMYSNAGMFPENEKMALRFSEISCEAAKQIDIIGYWQSFMQDYLVHHICSPETTITSLGNLEPYNCSTPWSAALKGKKVLVIHPFKKTIEAQYKKRNNLFDDPNVLPDFELTVMQAVQTIAGTTDERFSDWEEALNYMHDEAMKHDFDVAIIGCGAYGMPLAAKLKNSGKIAIHLGGATQLLFGIKGRRWDNHKLSRFYNEHWVRPSEEETPQFANQVENSCYW